ncbi:RNA polymerase sigma factor [uncultured Oscillibacter sp.]|uniref:RNA polymerase sigma factor n=1 Tax=uncultured Oscillibacter sp. TaxID=876091 RepID=UPI0025E31DDE|nr:sigma-70 region 4 domain-containing protein [uncultured Oscillibacter sp.]
MQRLLRCVRRLQFGYRTFQDDSKASIAIQEIHDVLNLAGIGDSGKTIKGRTVHAFGVGDVVAPFTRVAGNLISRGVEYSPVNAVKGTVEIAEAVAKAVGGGNADLELQSKGVSDLARGMTGTVIAYGFMGLVKAFDSPDGVIAVIRAMPELYRQVLEMKFVLEYSNREIARVLRMNEATVATRISRGRKALMAKLEEAGYRNDG